MEGEAMRKVEADVVAYVVPYDLPSENVRAIQDGGLRRYIRSRRVKATEILHSLGVTATSSVVLVPMSRARFVDEAIREVHAIYADLNERLRERAGVSIGMPIVRKIPIIEVQVVAFRSLAERKLSEKLDGKAGELAKAIERIKVGVSADKASDLRKGLKRVKREVEALEALAKELGMEANAKFAQVKALIDEALEAIQEAM